MSNAEYNFWFVEQHDGPGGSSSKQDREEKLTKAINTIKEIYSKVFLSIRLFVNKNKINQKVLQKHLNLLVYPELKELPSLGELEVVEAICQSSATFTSAFRSKFV